MQLTTLGETGLLHASEEFRKLLIENPNLPLLVFAGQDASCSEWSNTACSCIHAYIGEFLDCRQDINDERVYTERDEFAEALEDHLYDEWSNWDGSEQEWEIYLEKRIVEYDPYWKPCIILTVDN